MLGPTVRCENKVNDEEYTKIAIRTILENIPKPNRKADRKHTIKSTTISDYKNGESIHLRLAVEVIEHPGIEFVYDKMILSGDEKRNDPETEGIIYASGFEESLFFHSKELPISGKVDL